MSYLKAKNPTITCSFTVGKLIDLALVGRLALHPDFQREYVAREIWARNYIGSIFQRSMNSVIHLRAMKDGTFQVIDGLQRITTLLKFFKGELKTPVYHGAAVPVYLDNGVIELAPSTMQEIQKLADGELITNRFRDFEVAAIVYDESMTDDEASEVFWTLNDNNDLKPQEKRNGILGVVSEYVREVSRIGVKYRKLPVLDVVGATSNGRMNIDEMVARAVQYEVWHQTKNAGIFYAYADAENLDNLYKSIKYRYNKNVFFSIAKEVERRFEFVRKVVEASGAPKLHTKNPAKVLCLYQLTYALEEKFGKNFKVDYPEFSQNLWAQISVLADTKLMGIFNRKKTEFSELLGLYSPDEVARKLALILGMIGDVGIIKKDSRRFFSLDEKYRRWVDQDCKCAVTGKELPFDEAIGGHIIPHSKGGQTTYDNLVILSSQVNLDMGDTPYYDYLSKYKLAA